MGDRAQVRKGDDCAKACGGRRRTPLNMMTEQVAEINIKKKRRWAIFFPLCRMHFSLLSFSFITGYRFFPDYDDVTVGMTGGQMFKSLELSMGSHLCQG
jgi:hypothetical protein